MDNQYLLERIEKLEQRIQKLETIRENEIQAEIARLKAENEMLETEVKLRTGLTFAEWLKQSD